ncbi:hypothetical protein OFB72_29430, partial [Escherichia coli]|nr:hypothetical protein [Escherichia coli]
AVEAVVKGTFKGGIVSLGLKEGGLDFALDPFNQALIPDALRRELEALKKAVISGQIKVPDTR